MIDLVYCGLLFHLIIRFYALCKQDGNHRIFIDTERDTY